MEDIARASKSGAGDQITWPPLLSHEISDFRSFPDSCVLRGVARALSPLLPARERTMTASRPLRALYLFTLVALACVDMVACATYDGQTGYIGGVDRDRGFFSRTTPNAESWLLSRTMLTADIPSIPYRPIAGPQEGTRKPEAAADTPAAAPESTASAPEFAAGASSKRPSRRWSRTATSRRTA